MRFKKKKKKNIHEQGLLGQFVAGQTGRKPQTNDSSFHLMKLILQLMFW